MSILQVISESEHHLGTGYKVQERAMGTVLVRNNVKLLGRGMVYGQDCHVPGTATLMDVQH